jgi:hypothetical protein
MMIKIFTFLLKGDVTGFCKFFKNTNEIVSYTQYKGAFINFSFIN